MGKKIRDPLRKQSEEFLTLKLQVNFSECISCCYSNAALQNNDKISVKYNNMPYQPLHLQVEVERTS